MQFHRYWSDRKFEGHPLGIRALELWDSGSRHYFLSLFGRPMRKSACECERNSEASISQVLHVMNSRELQNKLSHPDSWPVKLAERPSSVSSLTEDLYLSFYSRYPTVEEHEAAAAYFAGTTSRREAAEDLAWSLMNSYEFLFNH